MRKLGMFVFVAIVAGLFLFAGCTKGGGGSPTSTSTPDQPNQVHIVLTEWSISGAHGQALDSLPAGDALIEVHNNGSTYHQLAIWKGGTLVGDEVQGGTLVAKTDLITPGDVTTLRVTLAPSEYILTCPITGHTELGMHEEVTARMTVQDHDDSGNDHDNGDEHHDE